jgi:hypothetical protein
MKQQQQVNFNAVGFQRLHGHMPRGRALWIFYFQDDPQEPWVAGLAPRTYQEAKQLAAAEACRRGVTSVRVDPEPL